MAEAQESYPATVTEVVDGDTLHARLADNTDVTVRLIGIDTPETRRPGTPVECGGPQASAKLEELVEGRAVNLVSDPTQNTEDRYGRSLLYVDRTDGLDVGRELIRTGWAGTYVFDEREFQRLSTTGMPRAKPMPEAQESGGKCRGDFH